MQSSYNIGAEACSFLPLQMVLDGVSEFSSALSNSFSKELKVLDASPVKVQLERGRRM